MLMGMPKIVKEWTFSFPSELHVGSWSPNGLSNFQKAIAKVNTHLLEKFFISLESYWNLDV
jgi:hypothetical protein